MKVFNIGELYDKYFWDAANEKWMNYYKRLLADHSIEQEHGLRTLTGFYSILRENWDNEKHYIWETVPDAMRRLGLDSSDFQMPDNEHVYTVVEHAFRCNNLAEIRKIHFNHIDKKI